MFFRTKKKPILISYSAISNGKVTLLRGQISWSSVKELSFEDYSWHTTFRRLLAMYRASSLSNTVVELYFDKEKITATTDASGFFSIEVAYEKTQAKLSQINLSDGQKVSIMENLYSLEIRLIEHKTIIITDIDDTILHSNIRNPFLKFRTLMFTRVEKRKAVEDMKAIITAFTNAGGTVFYLSNSEQNLYPLIRRFLTFNKFPTGPLFLKRMRNLSTIFVDQQFIEKELHKLTNLEKIFRLFPDCKFILLGDNTQHDLPIYLKTARKFPQNIRYIIIRRVHEKSQDQRMIEENKPMLEANGIKLFYEEKYPKTFEL